MATILVRGVPFEHSLSPAELAKAIQRISVSRSATKIWVKKLQAAIKEKNEGEQAHARDWLLHAPEAILTSAITANTKLKKGKRGSLVRCLGIPGQLDFSKPIPEIVRVRPKPKKPTAFGNPVTYRMLHDHGLLHRTAQHVVMSVLGPYLFPRAFQFTHLGPHAAITRAKILIKAGYTHAEHLDIEECYPSFSAEALINELPLPKEVVGHAVVGRHMKAVLDQRKIKFSSHTKDSLLAQARRGIPLGSASSPIVSMICVSRLAFQLPPGVALLNYADDFQLLAKSPKALKKSTGKLTDAVAKLPGGHFKLKTKGEGSAITGIDFLGHRLQIVNGELRTKPTEANLQDVYDKLNKLEERFGQAAYGPGKINQAKAILCAAEQYAFIDGWLAAFSECDDMAIRWAKLPIAKLDETLTAIGISTDQIAKVVEPWMGYTPDNYALGI